MFKSNWFSILFAVVLMAAVSGCCCCHEDDNPVDCPDLIVQEIDLNSLQVSCPGGGGTCVTTVTFTIANIGTANAGAFSVEIVLDPAGGVILTEFVGSGLAAGSTLAITVTSPPGGNCYDPNCTIDVTVDINDEVQECDENNNQLVETRLG